MEEPSKKGKSGRVAKKVIESEDREEDSSLRLGPESEPVKSCCCPLLFRL
jgi:hypothetical protein